MTGNATNNAGETAPWDWRVQLLLARAALQSRDLDCALALYQEALRRAGDPIPGELLEQMSGDLGNAAHFPELLRLTSPCYVAEIHGLPTGLNVINAYLNLSLFDAARNALDHLYALRRDDWRAHLDSCDKAISKARRDVESFGPIKFVNLGLLKYDAPIWLAPRSPAAELFSARGGDEVKIVFLGGTTDMPGPRHVGDKTPNLTQNLSRTLTLYLAEQALFRSTASVNILVAWTLTSPHGFFHRPAPWSNNEAARYAGQSKTAYDYAVIVHLKARADQRTAEVRLVRPLDAVCLGTITVSWPEASPSIGVPKLVSQLLDLLATHADISLCHPPSHYQEILADDQFERFFLHLGQVLVLRCICFNALKDNYMSLERDIIEGFLKFCHAQRQDVVPRIMLAEALACIKKLRPKALAEYHDKIGLLQKEMPLAEPAHGVVQRMFNEVLA